MGLGLSICFDNDPVRLAGSVSVEFGGETLAKIQYTLGEPVSLNFRVSGIGKGTLTIAVENREDKHSLVFDILVTGPFGIQILKNSITVDLPF